MNTYDRYLLKKLIAGLLLGTALYSIMFLIQNLFVLSEIIVEQHANPILAIEFTLSFLPKILGTVFPFAVLFAGAVTAGYMAGNSELVVVNATGMSIRRQLLPYVIFGFLACALIGYLEFSFVPASKRLRDRIYNVIATDAVIYAQGPGEFSEIGDGHYLRFMRSTDKPWGRLLEQVSLFARTGDGVSWTSAKHAKIRRVSAAPPVDQDTEVIGDRLVFQEEQVRLVLELEDGVECHVAAHGGRVSRLSYQQKQVAIELDPFVAVYDSYSPRYHSLLPFPFLLSKSWGGDRKALILVLSRILSILFVLLAPVIAFVLGFKLQRGSGFSGAFLVSFTLGLGVITLGTLLEAVLSKSDINVLLVFAITYICMYGIVTLRVARLERPGRADSRRTEDSSDTRDTFVKRLERKITNEFLMPSTLRNRLMVRYTVLGFLRMFGLVFISLEGLYLLIMALTYIPKLLDNKEIWPLMVKFVAYSVPATLVYAIPLAFVIAALFYVSLLLHRLEITAMKSVGLSVFQVLTPILWLGLTASLLLAFCTTFLGPYSSHHAESLKREMSVKRGKTEVVDTSGSPISDPGERIVLIELDGRSAEKTAQNGDGPELAAFYLDKEGYEVQWVYLPSGPVENGLKQNGSWIPMVSGVPRPDPDALREILDRSHVLGSDEKPVDEITSYHLRKRISRRKGMGIKPWGDITSYYQRFAAAFSPLIVLLIGLPLMFRRTGRQTRPAVGIMVGLLLVVSYYALSALFLSLGAVNYLPPFMAAWMVNLIFATVGLMLYTSIRT